jgi:hypothetical protein
LEVGAEASNKIFQKLFVTLGEVQGGSAAKGTVEVLDRMGITARVLNGEIDSTDKLIDAIAQAANRYNSTAQFTADVSELVGKRLGPQLAAALKDGGSALKEAEKAFRDTGAVIDKELIDKLAKANERIDSFAERSKNRIVIWAGDLLEILEKVGRGFDRFLGQEDLGTRSGVITARMKAMEELERLKKGTFGFLPVSPQAIANQQRYVDSLTKMLRAQEAADPSITDPMTRLFGNMVPGYGGAAPRPTTPAKATKSKTTASARTSRDNDFVPANMRSGWALGMAGSPELDIQNQALRSMADTMRELQNYDFKIDLIDRAQLQLAEDYTRTLTEGLAQAVIYGRNFGDVLKGIAQQILSSGLINILSGGKFGSSFGDSLGAIGSIFGGFRAGGGPVSAGKAYVVGEKRPELFVPSTAGYIMPNVPGGGGQGGTTRVVVEPSPLFAVTVIEGATQAARAEVANGIAKATRPRMTAAMGV